jgi:hypothetical protein
LLTGLRVNRVAIGAIHMTLTEAQLILQAVTRIERKLEQIERRLKDVETEVHRVRTTVRAST